MGKKDGLPLGRRQNTFHPNRRPVSFYLAALLGARQAKNASRAEGPGGKRQPPKRTAGDFQGARLPPD